MYSGKSGCIRGKRLYSDKVIVFLQSGCARAKVIVFVQKWLYSGKSGCMRAKVVVFEQNGCNWSKVVVFGQSGCNWVKVVVFGQKWFYSG